MDENIPFEGTRVSVCQGCGTRTELVRGYCNRCRTLGAGGIGREGIYIDGKKAIEDAAIDVEKKRIEMMKKRELEKEPTEEELASILQKRTMIYERKKRGDKSVPESVDAKIVPK